MTVFAILDILIDPDNQSSAGSRSLGGLRTSMTSGSSFGPVPTECRTEFLRVRIVVIEAKDVLGEIGIGAEGERGVPDDLFLLGRNEVYFNHTLDAARSGSQWKRHSILPKVCPKHFANGIAKQLATEMWRLGKSKMVTWMNPGNPSTLWQLFIRLEQCEVRCH